MTDKADYHHILRVAELPQRKVNRFSLRPNAAVMAVIARELGLSGLKKLNFEVELAADGARDWSLSGKLGATVTQACVVSLAPVTTRLDEPVRRHFVAGLAKPDTDGAGDGDEEIEMQSDEAMEPLGQEIDLGEIMVQALALVLPPYPRAEGAALKDAQFTQAGSRAMQDEDTRPFAGLAAMIDPSKKDQ